MRNQKPLGPHYITVGVLLWLTILHCSIAVTAFAKTSADGLEYGSIDKRLAQIAFAGDEFFAFDVFWSGGIKIGEIYLAVRRINSCADCFEIDSTITTNGGIIDALYPVEDRHITKVSGSERLPYFCEIWQKQGRNYRAHKIIRYDQINYVITKQKDGDPLRRYEIEGTTHNEFSSFFASRLMDLRVDKPFLVPTFGDDKRNEVVVQTIKREMVEDTVLGSVQTLKVTPILTFSGLYDKKGDTVIWYTDDECRVPVHIQSKIVIGSLTASLVKYTNPRCIRYNGQNSVKNPLLSKYTQ